MAFTAVDWNNLKDPLDLDVWNRMTGNFWLPEKIPLSNDLPSWSTVPREEQLALERAFAGLTVLDTIQSEVGAHAVSRLRSCQALETPLVRFAAPQTNNSAEPQKTYCR